LDWLLREFRLLVNKSIRIATRHDIRSRFRLAREAYADLSRDHAVYKQYIPSSFEVALGVLKARRRSLNHGRRSGAPYVQKLMLKAENQSYRLDRKTGCLQIPVRPREYITLRLTLSPWHKKFFDDERWKLGSLTIVPHKAIVILRRHEPHPVETRAAIGLDTNEETLDGVLAGAEGALLFTAQLGEIRRIQATHFLRRRKLARKKANDRRLTQRLLAREGHRERNRVRQKLHLASKQLVSLAARRKAVIVLEALKFTRTKDMPKTLNRRLSIWPWREIHRQIEYKAALQGVPVMKVNPGWTSKTCPVCGARRRDRVGEDFVCLKCDWEMDRQHNAGLNILKTALASNEALARAVLVQPDALRDDVVIPLCDVLQAGGFAKDEPSGVEPDELAPTNQPRDIRQSQIEVLLCNALSRPP